MAESNFPFVPNENCWKTSQAKRAAVLVDAKDYFESLAWAAENAERSLFFLCWDIDSRISLLPREVNGEGRPATQPLADFLLHLVETKPQLEIYILAWDFPALFAHERESKNSTRARFQRHPRIHFRFAPCGPLLISHHQKIAVVDDRLAFCGGLDVTQQRWDTPEHRAEHPVRKNPEGEPYGPFHDVQMVVEGAPARDLGELFRASWARHARVPGPALLPAEPDATFWPPHLEPLLRDVPVAISRTVPAWRKEEEVRESEQLFVEAIKSAKDYIFVENQYLTSRRLGNLLAERLKEENPPEILLLVRLQDSDWKEGLMGVLRARFVRKLSRADSKKKLLVLCPAASAKKKEWLNLHSKVYVADDEVLRVGSSNLCNRSHGMDFECDLTLSASRPEDKKAVRAFRNHLLAHHLGVSEAEVASETASLGLLPGVRKLLHRSDQTLVACPQSVNKLLDLFSPSSALIDPDNPREFAAGVARALLYVALLVGAVVAFPFLKDLFRQETVLPWAEWVQRQPLAPLGLIGLFTLLASLAFPLVPLALAFALLLPPWQTFLCLSAGTMLSAVVTYYVPRWMSSGQATEDSWASRLLASERLGKFRGMLEREGFWPIVLFRLIPIAPFWIENVLMGLLGIKFSHYLLATFLSVLPGFVMISFLEDQLSAHGGILTMIAIFCALFALLGWGIQKGLRHFIPAAELHADDR